MHTEGFRVKEEELPPNCKVVRFKSAIELAAEMSEEIISSAKTETFLTQKGKRKQRRRRMKQ
jgi:hypothetical protein